MQNSSPSAGRRRPRSSTTTASSAAATATVANVRRRNEGLVVSTSPASMSGGATAGTTTASKSKWQQRNSAGKGSLDTAAPAARTGNKRRSLETKPITTGGGEEDNEGLDEYLQLFKRLNDELTMAKRQNDENARAVIDCLDAFLDKPKGTPEVVQGVQQIAPELHEIIDRMVAMSVSDLKKGTFSKIVIVLRGLQLRCPLGWKGREHLTRLLISMAQVTRIVQHIQMDVSTFAAASKGPVLEPTSAITERSPMLVPLSVSSDERLRGVMLMPSASSESLTRAPSGSDQDLNHYASNIVFECSSNRRIEYMSPSSKAVLGYSPDELVGTDGSKFLETRDNDKWEMALQLLCDDPNHISELLFRIRTADGTPYEMQGKGILAAQPESGVPIRSVWVCHRIKEPLADSPNDALSSFSRLSLSNSASLAELNATEICRLCDRPIPVLAFQTHVDACGDLYALDQALRDSQPDFDDLFKQVALEMGNVVKKWYPVSPIHDDPEVEPDNVSKPNEFQTSLLEATTELMERVQFTLKLSAHNPLTPPPDEFFSSKCPVPTFVSAEQTELLCQSTPLQQQDEPVEDWATFHHQAVLLDSALTERNKRFIAAWRACLTAEETAQLDDGAGSALDLLPQPSSPRHQQLQQQRQSKLSPIISPSTIDAEMQPLKSSPAPIAPIAPIAPTAVSPTSPKTATLALPPIGSPPQSSSPQLRATSPCNGSASAGGSLTSSPSSSSSSSFTSSICRNNSIGRKNAALKTGSPLRSSMSVDQLPNLVAKEDEHNDAAGDDFRSRSLSDEMRLRVSVPSIEDFAVVKAISKGAFGRVFLAKHKRTGDYFAIKVLRKTDMVEKNQVGNVKNERNIMKGLDNPFVVKLFYSFMSESNLYLVMEYLNGGDCAALLKNVGCLDEKWAQSYIAEVVLALEYLHLNGIVHRDLKPDNLVIDSNGHLKLTDFGLSRVGFLGRSTVSASPKSTRYLTFGNVSLVRGRDDASEGHSDDGQLPSAFRSRSSTPLLEQLAPSSTQGFTVDPVDKGTVAGTPDYLAPEAILGLSLGPAVDWWALGVILFEFLVGVPPFNDDSPVRIFENIINRTINWDVDDDNKIGEIPKDLINQLLTVEMSSRLGFNGADEVKKHAFLCDIEWDNLMNSTAQFIPKLSEAEDTDYFDSRGVTVLQLERELMSNNESTGSGSNSIGIAVSKSPASSSSASDTPKSSTSASASPTPQQRRSPAISVTASSRTSSPGASFPRTTTSLQRRGSLAAEGRLLLENKVAMGEMSSGSPSDVDPTSPRSGHRRDSSEDNSLAIGQAAAAAASRVLKFSNSISSGSDSGTPVDEFGGDFAPYKNLLPLQEANRAIARRLSESGAFPMAIPRSSPSAAAAAPTSALTPSVQASGSSLVPHRHRGQSLPSSRRARRSGTETSPLATNAPLPNPETGSSLRPDEKKRILILESNPVVSLVLRKILVDNNCHVTVAKDAGSAVMAYTQAAMPFSLIFMDVSDSQSGVDAAGRLLRAIERPSGLSVPIVAMAIEKNFHLSDVYVDVLMKPFSRDSVMEKVKYWTSTMHTRL